MEYIKQVLAWLQQYPELVAVVLGSVGSWAASAFVEAFVNPAMDKWRQRQITMLANLIAGSVFTSFIWLGLDPKDTKALNYTVSIIVGLTSPFTYIPAAMIVGHFLPWMTAWTKPKE